MAKSIAKLVMLLTPKRRWAQFSLKSLLVVMTLCCVSLSIQATRSTSIRFADEAARRGIERKRSPLARHPMMFGGGCALADFDDDGWLDVLLVDAPNPVLYRNTGHEETLIDVACSIGSSAIADNLIHHRDKLDGVLLLRRAGAW